MLVKWAVSKWKGTSEFPKSVAYFITIIIYYISWDVQCTFVQCSWIFNQLLVIGDIFGDTKIWRYKNIFNIGDSFISKQNFYLFSFVLCILSTKHLGCWGCFFPTPLCFLLRNIYRISTSEEREKGLEAFSMWCFILSSCFFSLPPSWIKWSAVATGWVERK